MDFKHPTAPSHRWLDLLVVAACTLLGLSSVLQAEPARGLAFLIHYAARLVQEVLALLRNSC